MLLDIMNEQGNCLDIILWITPSDQMFSAWPFQRNMEWDSPINLFTLYKIIYLDLLFILVYP